jgi:hypothetical protein
MTLSLKLMLTECWEIFMTASPLPSERLSHTLVSDNSQASRNGCGFPDKEAHKQDSKFLFMAPRHDESEEQQGEETTLFFVLAFAQKIAEAFSMYVALFNIVLYRPCLQG